MRWPLSAALLLVLTAHGHAGERYLVRFEDTVRNDAPATLRRIACDLVLPQSGHGQRVHWVRLSPHDFELRRSAGDGWTAHAVVDVLAAGDAVTFAWLAEIEFDDSGAAAPSQAELAACLADDEILGLDHDAVRAAATAVRAAADDDSPHALAYAALAHVRQSVSYELDGGWRSAPDVLLAGEGSCSESTFAFVAICRRLGIPARWTGGTLLRGGYNGRAVDSTFHRLAEVHLPDRGFVPVETTAQLTADAPAGLPAGPSRMLVLARASSSASSTGLYYHARNSWFAPRKDGKPLPRSARATKLAFWTVAPLANVDAARPLHGLAAGHRPSFPRAELVLAAWERLSAPVPGGFEGRPERAPRSVRDALPPLAAAGHPALLRVAADQVWRTPEREAHVREAVARVLDDGLAEEFLPLLGREPAVFAAWWGSRAARVVADRPGRLTLRSDGE